MYLLSKFKYFSKLFIKYTAGCLDELRLCGTEPTIIRDSYFMRTISCTIGYILLIFRDTEQTINLLYIFLENNEIYN